MVVGSKFAQFINKSCEIARKYVKDFGKYIIEWIKNEIEMGIVEHVEILLKNCTSEGLVKIFKSLV